MRVIGGLVRWPGAPPAAGGVAALDPGVEAASVTLRVPGGGDGWLAATEADAPAAAGPVAAVADLALTNGDELRGEARPGQDRPALPGLLVDLYRRAGPRFVEWLEGGFALALWDAATATLLLAVDRFGIKRLHYLETPGLTAFASRPGRLPALAGRAPAADPTTVFTYLHFGYVPAPASIFAGVRRLSPGTTLTVRDGRGAEDRYWDMAYPVRRQGRPAAATAVLAATEAAVAGALRETTVKETGAFLSGGTDSSTVVALMSRLTGERVNAFSIGFAEARFDELGYAELTARHVGAAHYTRQVGADDAFAWLPDLVAAHDEPSGNSSAIGTYACARLARECGVRRLLAGDGGDEVFGGNERYRKDRFFAAYHRIPGPVRRLLVEPALLGGRERKGRLLGRAQRYLRRARLPNPRRFYHSEFYFAREGRALLAPDFVATVETGRPDAVLQAHYDRAPARDALNRLLYLDLKLTIGDNDLLKVTRTADLAGVDVRFPFLDRRLVELTGTWPPRFKVRGLEKRVLFKEAFRGLLAPETLAKRKHGFGVPTSAWLATHPAFHALARETLLSPRSRQRGYFRPGALEALFERMRGDTTPYHGDILWNVLMLELWHRRHLDGGVAA